MHKAAAHIDVQIIGAGIAGLSLALYLSEQSQNIKIALMAKGNLEACNTAMAKGGIAAVQNFEEDSFAQHIADTYAAGHQKGEKGVIEEVVKCAPQRLKDLIRWGVVFDCGKSGFDLHREGGHSCHRILHHADYTGRELHSKLLSTVRKKKNIVIQQHSMAIDFIVKKGEIAGLLVLDENNQKGVLNARLFVLASGGGGQLFAHTTNAKIATADGVAMASRIGAKIKDLQYFQFHPTAIYKKGAQQLDLLTEALRGYGAHLINLQGERFMFAHDASGELANRAVVSRAIFMELKRQNCDCLYLDLRHLDAEKLKQKFPSAYYSCRNAGYDPAKVPIPIVPAAHYQCGGVLVNRCGQSNIANLYAIGECACTNFHGNNRLASNSLSEALVYAHNAAESIRKVLKGLRNTAKDMDETDVKDLSTVNGTKYSSNLIQNIHWIRSEMSKIHSGIGAVTNIEETESKLRTLKERLNREEIHLDKSLAEFRNIVEVAILYLEEKKQHESGENIGNTN